MRAKRVRLIESRPVLQPNNKMTKDGRRRVAAYARVSTDSEEQLTSYETQVSYYTKFIQSNPEWSFVEVYTDEGISGLMTKQREGFQRMVQDALAGKIDLIITKSVSRFARNTVDTLTHVRQLKEKGVEVYFEKENIYTLDSKGELLITIMSSLAQEESRSISENVTWGKRKRFADGQVTLPYKSMLGFRKGKDGRPEVVPKEAVLVRRIYNDFLSGMSYSKIAKNLTEEKIKTPGGKENWRMGVIHSILTNEKYMGDALLQKRFVVDFLTKKTKLNEGEVPQYYVEDSHEAIVSKEVFAMVQSEVAKRDRKPVRQSSAYFFSARITCGDCGEIMKRKTWHSNDKYRRIIWQCSRKYKQDQPCTSSHFTEDEIKAQFIQWANGVLGQKTELIRTVQHLVDVVLQTDRLETKLQKLVKEADRKYEDLNDLIQKSSKVAKEDDASRRSYDREHAIYQTMEESIKQLRQEIEDKSNRRIRCQQLLGNLQEAPGVIQTFDERLWVALVDEAVAPADGSKRIEFRMRGE